MGLEMSDTSKRPQAVQPGNKMPPVCAWCGGCQPGCANRPQVDGSTPIAAQSIAINYIAPCAFQISVSTQFQLKKCKSGLQPGRP